MLSNVIGKQSTGPNDSFLFPVLPSKCPIFFSWSPGTAEFANCNLFCFLPAFSTICNNLTFYQEKCTLYLNKIPGNTTGEEEKSARQYCVLHHVIKVTIIMLSYNDAKANTAVVTLEKKYLSKWMFYLQKDFQDL